MKIREIQRTANVAWSPSSQHPIRLAAATAAQQLDSSFSTNACLELFLVDFDDTGSDLKVDGSIATDHRIHKLVWSPGTSGSDSDLPSYLVGGAEQGRLYVWSPGNIIRNEEPLMHLLDKHVGAVSALDINPFQVNLLTSGAGNSEIFIWDLNDPSKPMTPGSKSQPLHDVVCVAWNKQVQHILGSSQDGNCIVWDLRKNEPIIKIRDSMSRMKCSLLCWHPDVATQLCIASEDDHTPAIQLWDLRSATSPVKQFESHNRGVLSMSWCPQDSGLLLSCGKDNRILCWNPNSDCQTGEVVYELPNSNQWCFDVQWCPRNPGVISGCSFDGHVSLYSITQGSQQPLDKVSESFSTDVSAQQMHSVPTLKTAPKWLKRPCGATFSFGGKLITFASSKTPGHVSDHVILSQVVTEPFLVRRSLELEEALNTNDLIGYCDKKIHKAEEGNNAEIWHFLKVSHEQGFQDKYLKLVSLKEKEDEKNGIDCPIMSNHVTKEKCEEGTTKIDEEPQSNKITLDVERSITKALLEANFQDAVEICLENKLLFEAMMLAFSGGQELFLQTQQAILKMKNSKLHKLISSVVSHDIESIVRSYEVTKWREILLIILTYAYPQELTSLCNLLGERLEGAGDLSAKSQLCYIVARNVEGMVSNWSKIVNSNSLSELQDIIEKVTILQNSMKNLTKDGRCSSSWPENQLVERLVEYAEVLAEQGCALVAMRYLVSVNDLRSAILKDRFFNSLGREYTTRLQAPPKPFHVIDIKPQIVAQKKPLQGVQRLPSQTQQLLPNKMYPNEPMNHPPVLIHPSSDVPPLQQFTSMEPPLSFGYNSSPNPVPDFHGRIGLHQQGYANPGGHLNQFDPIYNPIPHPSSLGQNVLPPGMSKPVMSWNDPTPPNSQTSQPDQVPLNQPYQGQLYNPQDHQSQVMPPEQSIKEETEGRIVPEMPDEHRVVKDVFNKIIQNCFSRATNMPTKRKLDDVTKKMEVLYTGLCEGIISAPVTSGIHQIVSCIQQSDYNMALAYYTQIVSMGSFSEISSFFPSIKVLIQTATQLNVYIH